MYMYICTCSESRLVFLSQVAVGVLWLIAIVHIMLSVVLAALIAGACYYGKQKQRRRDNEITISEDTLARERSEGDYNY